MKINGIRQKKVVSNWLKAYPMIDQDYDLNKQ